MQVGLNYKHISSLKTQILPDIQEITTVSLLVHWLTVTYAEVPPSEDFSSQLSSLRLGKHLENMDVSNLSSLPSTLDVSNLSSQNNSIRKALLAFDIESSF